MPLDADLLDPTVDLPPHLQATFERMSGQNGGRNTRVMQYKQLAVQGKSPSDALAMSYDEQERRDAESIAALAPRQDGLRRDPNFFADGHLIDLDYGAGELPTPAQQYDAGFDSAPGPADAAPMGAGQDDPMAAPLGGLAGSTPLSAMDAPATGQIDTTRLDDVKRQIEALLAKPQAQYAPAPMPAPDSPSVAITALAMALAPPNQSGNIVLALTGNQEAIRQRNDLLAKLHAQTQDSRDKTALEALLKQAAIEESRADHAATLQTRSDVAKMGQEGQDRRLGVKESGLNQRQAARQGSQMAQLQLKLDRADNKKAAELMGEFRTRQEILRTSHPDWTEDQIDDKAAEYVNARPELTVQQTAKAKVETTYLQKTLNSRINEAEAKAVNAKLQGAYLKARTKYTVELTRFLPQAEALKWASLMALMDYRDRSLGLREEENDAGLDDQAVKSARTASEAANEEYEKYKSMLDNRLDGEGNALQVGSGDVDFNTGAVQGDDDTAAKIRRLMYFFKSAAMKAEETLDKATRDAQASQARAQERRKSQPKFRLPQLPGFVPGSKGNKPLDPTGGAFDRPPGEPLKLGGDVNPYSDVV